MDAKHIRKTIDDLMRDLARSPEMGRANWFMRRYAQPLGLAIGISGAAGCGGGGNSVGPDALPPPGDAYGVTVTDRPADREAWPPTVDAYGITMPDGPAVDAREALPPAVDAYGIRIVEPPLDAAREALPPPVDAYGITIADRPAVDGPDGPFDGSSDGSAAETAAMGDGGPSDSSSAD